MSTFLQNTPVWALPLFFVLLALGLRASRRRQVPVLLLYALPLLGLLTLNNIASLSQGPWIWLVALAIYALGGALGRRLQTGWIIARHGARVDVAGEWITLTAMMVLYCAGFVLGVLRVVAPEAPGHPAFAVAFTAIVCLASGQFLGRAIATYQS